MTAAAAAWSSFGPSVARELSVASRGERHTGGEARRCAGSTAAGCDGAEEEERCGRMRRKQLRS